MSSKIPVNFACQRCRAPLRIHQSLESVDSGTLSEFARLTLSEKSADGKQNSKAYSNSNKQNQAILANDGELNSLESTETSDDRYSRFFSVDDDFAVIGDTRAPSENEAVGIKLRAQAFLFDMLSSNTPIDHPLCADCCDTLISTLNKQLKQLEKEQADYTDYLNELSEKTGDSSSIEAESATVDREIEALEQKARELEEESAALERERSVVEAELEAKRDELTRTEREAEAHFRAFYATKYEASELEEEVRSLTKQCAFAESQLSRLRSKAVLDIVFRIDSVMQAGISVGTINGLRLGRFEDTTSSSLSHAQAADGSAIEWSEVNAALGQVCLCVQSLARKLNYEFVKYRLVPYGNYSSIESIGSEKKNASYLLYYSNQMMAAKKLDQAFCALLDCILQIQMKIAEHDPDVRFPYRIYPDKGRLEENTAMLGQQSTSNEKEKDKEKVVAYSVRLSNNSRENWTRACRCLLTNLKYCIAWCSSRID